MIFSRLLNSVSMWQILKYEMSESDAFGEANHEIITFCSLSKVETRICEKCLIDFVVMTHLETLVCLDQRIK